MSSVYSNFDHVLDKEVLEEMKNNPGQEYQHSAWNFCGYIKFEDGKFKEEVWVYGSKRGSYEDESIEELISKVNDKYGED